MNKRTKAVVEKLQEILGTDVASGDLGDILKDFIRGSASEQAQAQAIALRVVEVANEVKAGNGTVSDFEHAVKHAGNAYMVLVDRKVLRVQSAALEAFLTAITAGISKFFL